MITFLLLAFSPFAAPGPDLLETQPFEAPKYGVVSQIPKDWPIAVREEEDRVFVAIIPQKDFDRPGVAACELGLAPESLDEYRTRIDTNAKRNGRESGKLASNRVVKNAHGERLETIWEFHPNTGGFWREVSVRVIAHRQLYTLILNVEDSIYQKARPAFDALVDATRFSPPNTGADLISKPTNRWIRREYKFALDLPEDWKPVLAPSQVALLFANGQPHGVWSDNLLVLAYPHRDTDFKELAQRASGPASPGGSPVRGHLVPGGFAGKGTGPRDGRARQPRSVFHDGRRAAISRRPVRLRGQIHRRIAAVRPARSQASQELRELSRAPWQRTKQREDQGSMSAGTSTPRTPRGCPPSA